MVHDGGRECFSHVNVNCTKTIGKTSHGICWLKNYSMVGCLTNYFQKPSCLTVVICSHLRIFDLILFFKPIGKLEKNHTKAGSHETLKNEVEEQE